MPSCKWNVGKEFINYVQLYYMIQVTQHLVLLLFSYWRKGIYTHTHTHKLIQKPKDMSGIFEHIDLFFLLENDSNESCGFAMQRPFLV